MDTAVVVGGAITLDVPRMKVSSLEKIIERKDDTYHHKKVVDIDIEDHNMDKDMNRYNRQVVVEHIDHH